MPSRALAEAPLSRLEALRQKHAMYKLKIKEARKSPATAGYYLTDLKKQKLQVKEEMEAIRVSGQASA